MAVGKNCQDLADYLIDMHVGTPAGRVKAAGPLASVRVRCYTERRLVNMKGRNCTVVAVECWCLGPEVVALVGLSAQERAEESMIRLMGGNVLGGVER